MIKTNVEKTSGRLPTAVSSRLPPLWRMLFCVSLVGKVLLKRNLLFIIRELTQVRNHTDVVTVQRSLLIRRPLLLIRSSMSLKENLKMSHLLVRTECSKFLRAVIMAWRKTTNVANVAEPSVIIRFSSSIREFTPERSLISAGSVGKLSDGVQISLDIREFTLSRNGMSATKVGALKICSHKFSLVKNHFGAKNVGKPSHVKEVF